MPIISVFDKVDYFYEDSGAPERPLYITLICLHGIGYNCGIFRRLADVAADRGCRVLRVNRRGYVPTSLLENRDLEDFRNQEMLISQQGVELAIFVTKAILQCSIPEKVGSNGGVVVIGWSLGSLITFSFLANLDRISDKELLCLSSHLQAVYMHDPASTYFGKILPQEAYQIPWVSEKEKDRFPLFQNWATGYFEHEDDSFMEQISVEHVTPTNRMHSLASCPPHELQAIVDRQAFQNDLTLPFFAVHHGKELVRRAIFDQDLKDKFLPSVRVHILYGRHSAGPFVWAAVLFQLLLLDPETHFGGPNARNVSVHRINDANHFFFWDFPEKALAEYLSYLSR